MDKSDSTEESAKFRAGELEASAGLAEAHQSLSATAGLSVLLVQGHQPRALAVSNNNSICHAFQSSAIHAQLCEPYCGQAYERAREANKTTFYRCHAGLHCFASPIEGAGEQPLAVIGGRAFLRSDDYRDLAERIRIGDLNDLLSEDLFRNVIFSSKQDLDELAARLAEIPSHAKSDVGDTQGASKERIEREESRLVGSSRADEEIDVRYNFFPPGITLKEACGKALASLVHEHGIDSVALLMRSKENFAPVCHSGRFKINPPRVTFTAEQIKSIQDAGNRESIAVRMDGHKTSGTEGSAELFSLMVGSEVKGALVIEHPRLSKSKRRIIAEFCREIALPLEVIRLREELELRLRAANDLQVFTERLNTIEPDEVYAIILRHSAELLRAERGSLLLFDEVANELTVKAALGPRAEIVRESRTHLGVGVAGRVLSEGRPLVVRDLEASELDAAPLERNYKTGSFISYPIMIGGRKVGVLNVTDKAGGGVYDDSDLGLLEMIAPQMALALDRAEWHQKATLFQLLSITDPLTGLLNRRYLEERLSEELERSKRHRFAMCFMMIDIDDFKGYNDSHGHQAGDLALKMAAQCMKSVLRSADVAARYGGEEFSILLPQTNLSEAHVIAERIRRLVQDTQFPHGKSQPLGAVTISLGISTFGPHLDTPEGVTYAADQALYVAKNRGKNRIDSFVPVAPYGRVNDANRNAK